MQEERSCGGGGGGMGAWEGVGGRGGCRRKRRV